MLMDLINGHSSLDEFDYGLCKANDMGPTLGNLDPQFVIIPKNASSSMEITKMIGKDLCMTQVKNGGSRSHETATRYYFGLSLIISP